MPATPELIDRLEDLLARGQLRQVLALRAESPLEDPRADLAAATAAGRAGELEAAELLARRAHRAWSKTEDLGGLARSANVLGGIAFERGRLEEAESWFEMAIRRAYPLDDVQLAARISTNLGSIASLRGRRELAASFYRSALSAYRRLEDLRGQSQAYHNLALVSREAGDRARALEYADAAVVAARKVGDPALEALVLLGRAETQLGQGVRDQARLDLAEARRVLRGVPDALAAAEADRLEALLALGEHRYHAALRRAARGYARSVSAGALQLQAECAAVLSRAAQQASRPATARRFRRVALAGFQALGARGLLRQVETEPSS
jgi:tetratricopeptide (TPR) repeat protein